MLRPASIVRRLVTGAAFVTALVALAGCGSSTTVVTDRTPPTSQSTVAGAPASTGSTSTGGITTTTSASTTSGAPRCTAAMLALTFLGQQGATGHGELGFALRNTSARTCHTFGYPGVLFLSRSDAALPTTPQRVTRDLFGSAPVVGIDLSPGERASFRLGVTHVSASAGGCVTATAVQVIPPDDTHTLRVAVPGGAYECGTATVSPLRPGTSAFV